MTSAFFLGEGTFAVHPYDHLGAALKQKPDGPQWRDGGAETFPELRREERHVNKE
ncbi:Hypothetical protein SMAX5B_022721 [Scophthalmus maximus]|uniref:Uncharacterized protein n=1 Tax=Scophthalmus maximus TaxID=52904 RepID=A0A2U9BE96_SCOMX|nr:Hypothetical protein SMAX5B_022721 [Scophthalmus maximus]